MEMGLRKECEKARKQGIKNSRVCTDKSGELNLRLLRGRRSTSVCGKCR